MKIYLTFLISLIFLIGNAQAIIINEIMPDPDDGCNDRSEWIEITSHVNSSLENITIDTGEKPITLNGSIGENEFIIITKNATIFERIWNPNATVFESRGMSLRNKGDNISLYNGSSLLQKIEYNVSETNRSYGLCYSVFIPQNTSTPGLPNICFSGDTNQTNQTHGNETNVTNETCDLYLAITSGLIFNSDEKHTYYLNVEDKNCDQEEKEVSIEYWIEDLFGEVIKSEYTTTQSITCYKNISRQWTPKDIEGSEALYIKARIVEAKCNDSDSSNEYAEKLVIVKGGKSDPEECPPCEREETTCSCGPCPKGPTKGEEEREFEIVSYPEEAGKDEEIEIQIEIKNNLNRPRNYTVYSYVYEGNKPLSLGFDGNEWINTWDANKQDVIVSGNSSEVITLHNRIAEDTDAGEYKLRVRIWFEGKKHDMTREILVKEPLTEPVNQTAGERNETSGISESDNETFVMGMPTGRIISKGEENWFSAFIGNVINFFKNLFNL